MDKEKIVEILKREYHYGDCEVEFMIKNFTLSEIEIMINDDINRNFLLLEQNSCG